MWKRGENPPLPRSREGNERRRESLSRIVGMGRQASRLPEAGRPVHLKNLAGGESCRSFFTDHSINQNDTSRDYIPVGQLRHVGICS